MSQSPSPDPRRSGRRLEINLPVTCSGEDGKPLGGRAVALNVSRGGLLVLLSVRVPIGSRLWVEVRTPSQHLKAEVRVVRLEAERSDGLIPHGVAFVDAQGTDLLPLLFLMGLL